MNEVPDCHADETGSPFQVRAKDDAPPRATWALQTVLAPIKTSRFCGDYWGRSPLHIIRGVADFYSSLISLDELEPYLRADGIFDRNVVSTPYRSEHRSDPPPSNIGEIYERMSRGKPLRLRKLETVMHPKAAAIALFRDMERELGHRRGSLSCYIAPTQGLGLGPHHDETEIFTLQISGSKRWRIYGRVSDDLPGLYEPSTLGPPMHDLNLEAGDLLYLPSGMVHDVAAGPPSFSLTIVFEPFRWQLLLDLLASRLGRLDAFLETMPAGDPKDPRLVAHIQKGLLARLAVIAKELSDLSAADLIHAMATDVLRSSGWPPEPHLAGVLSVNEIAQESLIECVPGVAVQIEARHDRLVLHLPGGHSVQLGRVVEPALREILTSKHPRRVAEIGGDLAPPARLALARRLIIGGLLRQVRVA